MPKLRDVPGVEIDTKLTEFDGKEIQVSRIESITSEEYGGGYKLTFTEKSTGNQVYCARTFSEFAAAKLYPVVREYGDPAEFSADDPLLVTVRTVKNALHLE